jgi:plasmid stability protein
VRTTLTLDKDLDAALREEARRSGRPLERVVNEVLRAGLQARGSPPARRYRLTPVALGGVLPGIDLSRALQVADALEDEAIAHKLELRK